MNLKALLGPLSCPPAGGWLLGHVQICGMFLLLYRFTSSWV
jgi:hypothetical protein